MLLDQLGDAEKALPHVRSQSIEFLDDSMIKDLHVPGHELNVSQKGDTSSVIISACSRAHAQVQSVEALLLAAASELGLGKALEILLGERARVRLVLGG